MRPTAMRFGFVSFLLPVALLAVDGVDGGHRHDHRSLAAGRRSSSGGGSSRSGHHHDHGWSAD